MILRHDRETERRWLAGTLWPECEEARALFYLRRSLTDLRHALGTQAARLGSLTPQTLRLNLFDAEVDTIAFDGAIASGDMSALETAVDLYRGPLLEGCTEDWALEERRVREHALLMALETLAARAVARADLTSAVRTLRRAAAVDPLRESIQRSLMAALAADGDHTGVIQTYRALRLRLLTEVRAEPDAETMALYRRLCAAQQAARKLPATVTPVPAGSPPLHLPHPWTDLVGRETESKEIQIGLAGARLVTLTGPGGIGKTRLALHVAQQLAEEYPDGIWFVDLAGVSEPDLVANTLASSLIVREEPGCPLVETLQEHLAHKALLLVLDNCEHLITACGRLVGGLLSECPRLQVLATSRQSLSLTGEFVFQVPPLSLPQRLALHVGGKDRLAALMEYEAIRLFVERARQAHPAFALTPQGIGAIAQICLRLDGMPLAIELAAARVRSLSVREINERLNSRFRLLTGGDATASKRQQTLQASIDWSYALLNEQERLLLCRLSAFADGWTLEAAEAVCAGDGIEEGEVLDRLASLIDKSLVVFEERSDRARYRLLETIRQYSRERLAEWESAAYWSGCRHRDYYLAFA
ncbi:MAG TPA: BTAD domain-containing putative transcriptional regulator, partial [Chloroflexota bacterium]|nr:BTAD domain-containing putative transcriptional regulator [Chloroflexota bacterium]